MSKKYDKRASVKLDPDNNRRLREISKKSPLKPSLAKLANLLIRNHASELEVKN